MTTTTTPDPLLAAYQAGDYSTANQLIQQQGLSAQDIVNKYGLNQDQAQQVAQNLGYSGSLGNLNYAAPSGIVSLPSTTTSTPSGISSTPTGTLAAGWQDQAISLPVGNQTASSGIAALTGANATQGSIDPAVAQALADIKSGVASSLSPQQFVSNYHLNPTQAAQLAQMTGYTGNVASLNFGAPTSDIQSAIQAFQTAHPNATAADVATAAANYEKSTGASASNLYDALGSMAQSNPAQYESLLQNYNKAENIDPTAVFNNWLNTSSTIGGGTWGGNVAPDPSQIIAEANRLGIDLSNTKSQDIANAIGAANTTHPLDNPNAYTNLGQLQKAANTVSGLQASGVVNGANQTQALQSALLADPTSYNFMDNVRQMTSAGITPAVYAKAAGIDPSVAVASFNYANDPNAQRDLLAQTTLSNSSKSIPAGTQYSYGTDWNGQQVISYVDPTTGQLMMSTNGGAPVAAQTNNKSAFPQSFFKQTGVFGQGYSSPYNAKGQIDTSNNASLDSAYKAGLISSSDYVNAKQSLASGAAAGTSGSTTGTATGSTSSTASATGTAATGTSTNAASSFATGLAALAANPSTATASGIQSLIAQAQSDPATAKQYATQIQALQTALPGYQAQDAVTQAQSGTNVLSNYQNLVSLAQSNPQVAQALGPSTVSAIQSALGESGGGKYISTFEALTGLDKSLTSQAPQKLDVTNLPKGIQQVDDGNGGSIYQQQIQTPPGWDPGTKVYATYDASGNLQGFSSPNPVFPTDANGNMSKVKYDASWTASGAPTPQLDTSHGGVLSNAIQSMGPLGGLAIGAGLAALTGGVAAPLSDALTGALGSTLGAAATQGVLTGGLSSLLGGKFATGFEAGALGSGITQGLNAIPGMPSTASQYYTKPVGNALASSLVTGTPVGTNLANAAISGGLNQSLNNVPGLDAKTAGVIANLLPSIMTGKLNPASLVGVASSLGKATT